MNKALPTVILIWKSYGDSQTVFELEGKLWKTDDVARLRAYPKDTSRYSNTPPKRAKVKTGLDLNNWLKSIPDHPFLSRK